METSFPFNAVTVNGEPDRVYAAEDFAAERAAYVSNGVLSADALAVMPDENGTFAVTVAPGCAVIDGYTYRNTAPLTLSLAAADGVNPRLDLAVLRLDLAERRMYCAVLTGTPAEAPVVPVLTETDTVREIPLAEIAVAPRMTSLTAQAVTDCRVRADYILNRVEVEAVLAEYEAALEAYFGETDAETLTQAASVIRTDAGESQVLCGDGVYRTANLDGSSTVELVRFTSSGSFSPSAYPTKDGRYEILLLGGGGSGAYGSSGASSRGGGAGGFLVVSGVPLLSGKSYAVTIGAGGTGVTTSVSCAGRDGGATSFGPYTVPGGKGGVVGTASEVPTVTVGAFTAEIGTTGSSGTGGNSPLALGGKNNYKGSGKAGGIGAGGGAAYLSPSQSGTAYSGDGGSGIVIIRGCV